MIDPYKPDSAGNETSGAEGRHPLATTQKADAAATHNADPTAVAASWERATLEKLAFAALQEQRSGRRWRTFVRLAWLVFFVALLWFGMHQGNTGQNVTGPHTAVIEIKGEIASGADASAEMLLPSLRSAFEDAGAKAVVLLINSPG